MSARGANQIASCLYRVLLALPPSIKNVTLYSDTCGGQNKNSHMVAMFLVLMQQSHLETVDHKFLIPGHTRMECDSDHSTIERKKSKYDGKIEHPRDWMQLVRLCGNKHNNYFKVIEMKKHNFLDFASLLKKCFQVRKFDEDGNRFVWKDVKWLRYDKTFGKFLYKTSHNQNDGFKTMSFIKRSQTSIPQIPNCKYPHPITEDKMNNLLDLLPYIDDLFHNFYRNLPTEKNLRELYPDIDEVSDEEFV